MELKVLKKGLWMLEKRKHACMTNATTAVLKLWQVAELLDGKKSFDSHKPYSNTFFTIGQK